jgi:hypothetical protein
VNVWPATVRVPDRSPLVVDATLYCTAPTPVPLAPDVIVSQEALLVAVHAQPAAVVTSRRPVPPLEGTPAEVGSIEYEQPLPCVNVNVWPPIVTVPVRGPPLVPATASLTVPSPDPLAPDATVIQLAPLTAVQAHPGPAVTPTETSPPAASTCWDCGEMLSMQPADCVTVIWVPATVIDPERAGPVTGATVKLMPPPPLPDVGPVSAIHGDSLAAVHAHPAADSIVAEPVPPCAPNACASGSTAKLQPAPWVTVTSCPATSTLPDRGGPFVPSTTICAAPGPVPVDPCTTVAHGTLLAAVHGQPAAVDTATIVDPPPDPGE